MVWDIANIGRVTSALSAALACETLGRIRIRICWFAGWSREVVVVKKEAPLCVRIVHHL